MKKRKTKAPLRVVRVRVTRVAQMIMTDTVEVEIATRDEDADPCSLAKELIEAQDAAGQDVYWLQIDEEPVPYPSPRLSAEIISQESDAAPESPVVPPVYEEEG